MWKALGAWVLRFRIALLAILLVCTAFMACQASQVKLTRALYRSSLASYIWLGSGNMVDCALRCLKRMDELQQHRPWDDSNLFEDCGKADKAIQDALQELGQHDPWEALKILMEDRFWSLVRTCQEVMVSRQTVFYSGKEEVDRAGFHGALRLLSMLQLMLLLLFVLHPP